VIRRQSAGGKLEPVKRLVSDSNGEYAVLGSVRSPFEYAATVRGLMEFMTDFYRDPEMVRDLIAAVMPATLTVGKALAEAGVDAVVMKDRLLLKHDLPRPLPEIRFPGRV
jgi:uroporphyrinogen-III decarboxylase